jgi:F-type H+-transporting ATPase subunit delta
MPSTHQHHSPLAVAYAQSLLDLAAEQKVEEQIGRELGELAEIVGRDPQLRAFFESPGIGTEERSQVLSRSFKGQVSPLLHQFLQVANRRGMAGKLPQIAEAYENLLDERLGKIEVDVTVPQRLNEQELEQVRQRISHALGKDAVVHQYIDPDMIGGMILRVGDRIIDASVKGQLAMLKQQMLRAAVNR